VVHSWYQEIIHFCSVLITLVLCIIERTQEGNAFCTTLEPRLFTIDMNTVEHKLFFTELISLCEAEDQLLMKLPCYKSLTSLVSLRKSAMSM